MSNSNYHVAQIRTHLRRLFKPHIDMSDVRSTKQRERASCFYTRALAAFVPLHYDELEPKKAAMCVTDGSDDNGIDCVYYSREEQVLRVIQSKWHSSGRGSLDMGDLHKFASGIDDILSLRRKPFSQKFSQHWDDIQTAVRNPDTRIDAVFVTTGEHELSPHALLKIEDLRRGYNSTSEMFGFTHLKKHDLHSIISHNRQKPINLSVRLLQWGMTQKPYIAYYGQVECADLARWYRDYQHQLFSPNLRLFLGGSTDANRLMVETVVNHPDRFWYFNNGVTAICDAIRRQPLGGTSRESSVFECTNLRVVNGAQTIGSLATGHQQSPELASCARVLVRFISLENTPEGFALDITKGTNTQNRIEARDFAALDHVQGRLANELFIDGVTYAYKSGEVEIDSQAGFTLRDATRALAAAHVHPKYAFEAQRAISALWEKQEFYRELFNEKLTGLELWRIVQLERAVQRELTQRIDDRTRVLVEEGNLIVAHLVFRDLPRGALDDVDFDFETTLASISEFTDIACGTILSVAEEVFAEVDFSALLKYEKKCEELVAEALRRKHDLAWLRRNLH